MSGSSTNSTHPFSYVFPSDGFDGLLRLAAHVGLTATASLFLERDGNVWPLASSGTGGDAVRDAALLLPHVLDERAHVLEDLDGEAVVPDASLEKESTTLLASTLAGEPGFVMLHQIQVGQHPYRAVLILAHPAPRQQIDEQNQELIREIGRQIVSRLESHIEREGLKSGSESTSALHLHLEKLGSTRCVGHCIVSSAGRMISVSESLLTNLRLPRERIYESNFGDLFSFESNLYERKGDQGRARICWQQLHYSACTYQPDDGPSARLTACALQVPYPGESEAWNICLLREGDQVGPITGPVQAATILIAEDHPVNQRVIQGMVEKLGLRADVVSNGLEAVHAVCQKTYAAILMDCQMPEMDGVEATRFIRSNQESLGRIPILAVTAVGEEDDRRRCLEAGVDEFMVKPIRMEELAEILARWTSTTIGSMEDFVGEVDPNSRNIDEALDRLCADLDADVVRDIVMLFLDDSKARLDHLSAVADAQGWEESRALVHTLKGSSSSLGADSLVAACEAFEAETSQDPVVLRQRISVIEQRFKEAVPMLKAYLEKLPPG